MFYLCHLSDPDKMDYYLDTKSPEQRPLGINPFQRREISCFTNFNI